MRVKVTEPRSVGAASFGTFLGLLMPDHDGDTPMAVVRLDHYGLMLKLFHPSHVQPTTPEEEATYQP